MMVMYIAVMREYDVFEYRQSAIASCAEMP